MPKPLLLKLSHAAPIGPSDAVFLDRLAADRVRRYGAREDILREGDVAERVGLVLAGWACRYKVLEDGRRQIQAFLVPGDLCDPAVFMTPRMDHSVAAISTVELAELGRDALQAACLGRPAIARAFNWLAQVEAAIAREWIVNLGQRSALERLGHLFCELFWRLRAVGLTHGQSCDFPMTQVDLAETMGLSTVHVNRTLQDLRGEGLIELKGKTLSIPDLGRLQKVALFHPDYLHLAGDGVEAKADDGSHWA